MTPENAKRLLAAWRPVGGRPPDADVETALALARQDAALGRWWEQQRQFHDDMVSVVRQVPVPPDLAGRILAARKTVRPLFVGTPALWAAAAAVLLLGLATILLRPPRVANDASFEVFRSRMVRAVLREYRMDVVTNDLAALRGFLASRQAPDDFELPPRLAALPPLGGGRLSWQGRGVSMVCLDGGRLGTLFLFVTPADSLQSGRPDNPVAGNVSQLGTLSWTTAGRTFVLAAHAPPEDLRNFL